MDRDGRHCRIHTAEEVSDGNGEDDGYEDGPGDDDGPFFHRDSELIHGLFLDAVGKNEVAGGFECGEVVHCRDNEEGIAPVEGNLGHAAGDIQTAAVDGEDDTVITLAEIRLCEGAPDKRGFPRNDEFGNEAVHRGEFLRTDLGEKFLGFCSTALPTMQGDKETVVLFYSDFTEGHHEARAAAADFQDMNAGILAAEGGVEKFFPDQWRPAANEKVMEWRGAEVDL